MPINGFRHDHAETLRASACKSTYKLYARASRLGERRRSPLLTQLEIIVVINPRRIWPVFYDYLHSRAWFAKVRENYQNFQLKHTQQNRILTLKIDMYAVHSTNKRNNCHKNRRSKSKVNKIDNWLWGYEISIFSKQVCENLKIFAITTSVFDALTW